MLGINEKLYCKMGWRYFTFPSRAFSIVTTPPEAFEVPVC